ncbi:hypothetical protein CEP52_003478 [Fusarium oligoseptatum]|uniref:B3/B4 tRNA-binding domain-containing protein n=1 Tax=Fusarium oligoseptatum TaxID=2604345 RepID=A0A428U8M7_9HYPO|nr:hypothetical protein CEP52_003478 [Fusarium oligoseptatum]
MSGTQIAQGLLQAARVAPEIFKLRPDYRVLLLVVEGIPPGPSDAASEALLQEAEKTAKGLLAKHPTRNSLEALTRRVEAGLPRVNRLTDIYNAISVKYQIPLGGEDLDKYDGSPFLVRATGTEEFQTFSGGEPQSELASPGEPIWCDDTGITCRRWNWRQGPRTALTDDTTRVLFILDALEPLSDEAPHQAADELALALKSLSPEVQTAQRLISAPNEL